MEKKKKGRKLQYGVMTLVYTVFFIAALLLVNILFGVLSDRLGLQFDMTANKLYELSGETRELLAQIDAPIEITVFIAEDKLAGDALFTVIHEQLKRYAALSGGQITVAYIDPDLNNSLVEEYRKTDPLVGLGSVAVTNTATGRFKICQISEMIEVYSDSAVYNTETVSASAVHYVLTEALPRAAVITGHDGAFPAADAVAHYKQVITTLLTRANFEVVEVDLRSEELALDIGMLIMLPPSGDLTAEEMDKLDAYFSRSDQYASAIFFTVADFTHLPNYAGYLAEWGISLKNTMIMDSQMPSDPTILIPVIAEHESFGGMGNTTADKAAVYFARPIECLWAPTYEKSNHKVESLMISSGGSKAYTYEMAEAGSGPFTIGALGLQHNIDNEREMTSVGKLMVLPVTLTDMESFGSSYANERMLTHLVNYMSPADTKLTMPAKTMENPPLVVANKTLVWILYMAVPVLLLAAGLVVFIYRRHK